MMMNASEHPIEHPHGKGGNLVLRRKRSAADDASRVEEKRGYHGPQDIDGNDASHFGDVRNDKLKQQDAKKSDVKMKTKKEEEPVLDLSTVSGNSYLINVPCNILSYLGGILGTNDLTTLTMTCKKMYEGRPDYCFPREKNMDHLFHLVLEETLPVEQEFRSVMETFRFLFQSPKYGIIQVDFGIANPPKGGYQRGTPRLRQSYSGRKKKESWEDISVRINIQKKFPKEEEERGGSSSSEVDKNDISLYTPKVIFRLDQSLPGCCFHFESKYVVAWDAGNLGYLMQICVKRVVQLQMKRGATCEDGLVLVRPSLDEMLTKFQATIKENVIRCVKRKENK